MSLFNKPKKRINVRRKQDDDDGDDGANGIKELQKARERRNGLNEIECAVGQERARQFAAGEEMQLSGGTIVMTQKQKAKLEAQDIEKGMKEQFEKESLLRDEHEELRKFIEQGLGTVKAQEDAASSSSSSKPGDDPNKQTKPTDAVLIRAAEKVAQFKSAETCELLSNQMLAGIPEVDLGINARISNILETEQRKKELLMKSIRIAKLKASGFAPMRYEVKTDVDEAAAKRKRFSTD